MVKAGMIGSLNGDDGKPAIMLASRGTVWDDLRQKVGRMPAARSAEPLFAGCCRDEC